ncbi:hypothetical protein BGW80DRAFT_1305917 [Lactifluus volemus]|nr:hypothetical protein BGW80DRAFT_1305917 [Lactifluus volemus]
MLHDVGFPQGFPAQPEDIVHGPHGIYHLDHAAPDVPLAGPAQAAFPDPLFYHAPPPDQAENLRRFASRFLRNPNSQVHMVRMELGPAGRYRIVISLDTADFL